MFLLALVYKVMMMTVVTGVQKKEAALNHTVGVRDNT